MSRPASEARCPRPGRGHERRRESRQTAVLRVALLTSERGACFCLLKNVSANGFQARSYGDVRVADFVTILIPDENVLRGTVIWCRDGDIGVRLRREIDPSTVLRLNDQAETQKRRRLPRIRVSAPVTLKMADRVYRGELLDISHSGALATTTPALPAQGPVTLTLPDLDPIKGQVRWLDDQKVGIFFNTPLSLQALGAWLSRRNGGSGPNLQACA